MCEHCQNVKIPPLSRPLFSNRYRCPECGAEFREVVRIGKKRIGAPVLFPILNFPVLFLTFLTYYLIDIIPAASFVHNWTYWFYCNTTYTPFFIFYILPIHFFLVLLLLKCISHYEPF